MNRDGYKILPSFQTSHQSVLTTLFILAEATGTVSGLFYLRLVLKVLSVDMVFKTFIFTGFLVIMIVCISQLMAAHHEKKVSFRKRGGVAYCKDCDFFGADLTWYYASSFDECHSHCRWYGNPCTHFVYVAQSGRCFLKEGSVFTSQAFHVYDRQMESGIRCGLLKTEECRSLISQSQWIPKFHVGPPSKFLHSTGCYFNEDLPIASFYNATQEQCTSECRRLQSCTHYNFYLGNCDMFQGEVEYEDIQRCAAPHCHCGIDCHANTAAELCSESGEYEYTILQSPAWGKPAIPYQDFVEQSNISAMKAIEFKADEKSGKKKNNSVFIGKIVFKNVFIIIFTPILSFKPSKILPKLEHVIKIKMWEREKKSLSMGFFCLIRNFLKRITDITYFFLSLKDCVIARLYPGNEEKKKCECCDSARVR